MAVLRYVLNKDWDFGDRSSGKSWSYHVQVGRVRVHSIVHASMLPVARVMIGMRVVSEDAEGNHVPLVRWPVAELGEFIRMTFTEALHTPPVIELEVLEAV